MLAVFIELEVIEVVVSGFSIRPCFFFLHTSITVHGSIISIYSRKGGTKWEAHIARMSWQWGKGQHFCWQMLLLLG